MRFLLFFISLLHIHISRLPVFLAVLISCCIFGRPSKRTLMMLPVSHSPSAASNQRLHCYIESTFIQVQVDFPQNGFAVVEWISKLARIIASENSFSLACQFTNEHSIVLRKYSSGKEVRKTLFRKRQKSLRLQLSIWFEQKIYSALILRRETASRNCYWFYSERIAQNFNDDVWNSRNKGPNPKMRQRR